MNAGEPKTLAERLAWIEANATRLDQYRDGDRYTLPRDWRELRDQPQRQRQPEQQQQLDL